MPFTLTMPKLSPTMTEGIITKWHKKEGEFIKSGDLILDIATDKATIEHAALDSGYLRKILVKAGETVSVNSPIAILSETKDEEIEAYKPEGVTIKAVQPANSKTEKEVIQKKLDPTESRILASPLARRLAKERGIDLSTLKGSGPGHRIVSEDLLLSIPPSPGENYEERSLSPMRKAIIDRLQNAKNSIPHFYVSLTIRAEKLLELREQLNQTGLKISINDLIIRASALALRKHPDLNTGFNPVHQTLIQFRSVDISVAVSIPDGLITPIIWRADEKNLETISTEMKLLAQKAHQGKLKQEEYTGGSFTISNLGMYGISEFIAIINPPQAAILAVGAIENLPVVVDNQIIPGKVIKLTISADHRVIDGNNVSIFLKTVQHYLENPALLLLSISK